MIGKGALTQKRKGNPLLTGNKQSIGSGEVARSVLGVCDTLCQMLQTVIAKPNDMR